MNSFADNVYKRRITLNQPVPTLAETRKNPKLIFNKINYELDKAGFGEYHASDYNSAIPIGECYKVPKYESAGKEDYWLVEFAKDVAGLSYELLILACAYTTDTIRNKKDKLLK